MFHYALTFAKFVCSKLRASRCVKYALTSPNRVEVTFKAPARLNAETTDPNVAGKGANFCANSTIESLKEKKKNYKEVMKICLGGDKYKEFFYFFWKNFNFQFRHLNIRHHAIRK